MLMSGQPRLQGNATPPSYNAKEGHRCLQLARSGLFAQSIPISAFGGEPDYRQSAPRGLKMTLFSIFSRTGPYSFAPAFQTFARAVE